MSQPLLPPAVPKDDVIYWQAFYWACVNGHLYGGHMTRGAALMRMRYEQETAKALKGLVFDGTVQPPEPEN